MLLGIHFRSSLPSATAFLKRVIQHVLFPCFLFLCISVPIFTNRVFMCVRYFGSRVFRTSHTCMYQLLLSPTPCLVFFCCLFPFHTSTIACLFTFVTSAGVFKNELYIPHFSNGVLTAFVTSDGVFRTSHSSKVPNFLSVLYFACHDF